MSVVSRLSPLVAAVAVSGLLVAGPAYAVDPPVVGTAECTKAVDDDPTVKTAPADKLEAAKQDAEKKLCSPKAADPKETTTTSKPSSAPKPPPQRGPQGGPPPGRPGERPGDRPGGYDGRGPERPGGPDRPHPPRPGRPAGDRDCADFATQDAAQDYFESIGGSKDNNADRLDANHNGKACEDFFDDGDDQGADVTSTGDDNSTATTSGTQVKEVPEGSAQTGGA